MSIPRQFTVDDDQPDGQYSVLIDIPYCPAYSAWTQRDGYFMIMVKLHELPRRNDVIIFAGHQYRVVSKKKLRAQQIVNVVLTACAKELSEELADLEESMLCHDCREFCGSTYMVHDKIWKQSHLRMGLLCVVCLEARIGRLLQPDDFTAAPINLHSSDPMVLKRQGRS
ncbi:MAG: hypothetical protein ACYDA1_05520 [Vulcanimicrobiaceae bacterium]